jgi:DNA invertase Pin-like site-specific DNA recombinase
MADPVNFKSEFDILAKDGAIGAPDGAAAYAYIRVSDSDQAEDGRSGLPRQIQNIHEVATQRGYRIPWELVYAEDHTGFEFETRLQLAKLRRAFKSPTRAADVVVIEHLDGLSRESNWHQGFLLDEMQKHGIQAVFWKSFGSRIERAVMGAVSQDAMEQAKQRMQAGTRRRA